MDALTMAFTASNIFGKAFTPVTLEVLFPSTFASGFPCQEMIFTIVYKGGKWGLASSLKQARRKTYLGKINEIGIFQNSL